MNEEERRQMVRQQVNAKILWGAEDEEVRIWLAQKHRIHAEIADEMLEAAHAAKRLAVRKKAIMWLIFSSIGLALAGVWYGFQITTGIYYIGTGPILIGIFTVSCIGKFLQSLWQIFSGRTVGSVD